MSKNITEQYIIGLKGFSSSRVKDNPDLQATLCVQSRVRCEYLPTIPFIRYWFFCANFCLLHRAFSLSSHVKFRYNPPMLFAECSRGFLVSCPMGSKRIPPKGPCVGFLINLPVQLHHAASERFFLVYSPHYAFLSVSSCNQYVSCHIAITSHFF